MALNKVKITNEYSRAFGKMYSKTSKAVFAAIAFSLAMRLNEDNPEMAIEEFRKEWETLHAQGIIPQKPTKA